MEIYGNLYIEATIRLHLSKRRLFKWDIVLFITASGKVIKASARCGKVINASVRSNHERRLARVPPERVPSRSYASAFSSSHEPRAR